MSNENKAGALILSQIGMFSEATYLFEKVQTNMFESFDEIIKNFADENDWVGNFNLSGNSQDCWLLPKNWNLAKPKEKIDYKARFKVDYINDENDDHWTALFCKQGSASGEAGFKCDVKLKAFGGKSSWNDLVCNDPKIISNLTKLGFKLNKGILFFPIHLDANQLAETWEENGEFSYDDDCFEPLRQALGKLKTAEDIFSQILNQASEKKQGRVGRVTTV